MLVLVKLFGIVIVAMGSIFTFNPQALKQVFSFWQQGNRVYLVGVLRILIGIVLLMAASQCRLIWVVVTLGLLVLIKGVLIFILGIEKIKSMLNWWGQRPLGILRLMGLIALSIGALLLYSV